MSFFAQLDDQDNVVAVMVIEDAVSQTERDGQEWCQSFFGGGVWVQTSDNGSIRKNYAGIGYKYDRERDAFIPPKPFESWVLNETTCLWDAPIAMPADGRPYQWNENAQAWEEREI